MSLTSGTRLGPYEIVAPLGAGGMGEVYRATDTTLKRSVAIKMLPAAVAAAADRLTRFQREVEVLAALNHGGGRHARSDTCPECAACGAAAACRRGHRFVAMPDGQRLVVPLELERIRPQSMITLNWLETLQRRTTDVK